MWPIETSYSSSVLPFGLLLKDCGQTLSAVLLINTPLSARGLLVY
jgi:hypothetical protein